VVIRRAEASDGTSIGLVHVCGATKQDDRRGFPVTEVRYRRNKLEPPVFGELTSITMTQERIGLVVQWEYQPRLTPPQAQVSNEPGKARCLVTTAMGTREFLGSTTETAALGESRITLASTRQRGRVRGIFA
jgi:hypothetical protein